MILTCSVLPSLWNEEKELETFHYFDSLEKAWLIWDPLGEKRSVGCHDVTQNDILKIACLFSHKNWHWMCTPFKWTQSYYTYYEKIKY